MKTIHTLLLIMGLAISCASQVQVPSTSWVQTNGLPSGVIVLVVSGTCPVNFTEVSALNGKMLRGTLAANGDVGGTGGSATITPTGTVSTPSFTGTSNQTTSAVSGGTPAGTNGTVSFTPVGTLTWPAGVPTFAGTSFSSVINHTHTITLTSLLQGGTTAATTGTHIMTSTATGGSARAPTAGDSFTATSANPSGGVASITPAGTLTWPAGVPAFGGTAGTVPAETFTGSALGTHTHTLTPGGTVSQPTFTGNAVDPSPSYVKVIFCSKN